MNERRITDGARELRAYLTEINQSVPDFCDQWGFDRIQVQRVLTGERWKNITVNFALAMQTATKGRIVWTKWLAKTGRVVKQAA